MDELRPIDPELVFTFGMEVEWDDEKDAINREKHGYLLDSVTDWLRQTLLPVIAAPPPTVWLEQPMRDDGEKRYRMLTIDWEGHVVDFVFTIRDHDDGRRLRIISYRRANERELRAFWQHWTEAYVVAWLADAYPRNRK